MKWILFILMNVTIVLIVVLNYIFQINERKNVQKFFEMDFGKLGNK